METYSTAKPGVRAILVGVQLPRVTEAEVHASLDELGRLAKTLGLEVSGRLIQARYNTNHSTVLGAGKLATLAALTGGSGAVPAGASKRQKGSLPSEEDASDGEVEESSEGIEDDAEEGEPTSGPTELSSVILFDHDLTPSQIRNIEGATSAEVLDRTSVILSIFQRHARTREALIQVEIARLIYLAPRLRETGAGKERQRGGIGGKGAGESSLELNRRRVRDRIAELRHELVAAQREADLRRVRRTERDTVALVGYTNAGKSSLMRALTGSNVLVRDQLFATLDTTVRRLTPPTKPEVLVSDTVGFIKKLPHDLVASFRSTLEEARDAALLLYVVDASDASWREQLQVSREVLGELKAADIPSFLLLNKMDRVDAEEAGALAIELPDAIQLSAHRSEDVAALHARIVRFFERDMIEAELLVEYTRSKLTHQIHESCRVLEEEHTDTGTRLRVLASEEFIASMVTSGVSRLS